MEVMQPETRLIYCPHPVVSQQGRRIVRADFLPGESIAEYLERHGLTFTGLPVDLRLEGAHVPRAMWARVRPKNGQTITIRAVMHGGGGGGSNPIKTVLSIALMVYAPGISNWIYEGVSAAGAGAWLTATGMKVLSGVVGIGGSILLNRMMPDAKPAISQANGRYNSEAVSPTYSLTGGSNRTRLYEPLPIVFGTHRVFPDLAAKTYTEYQGDDQYLYQIFNFGVSDLSLDDFRIGATPISAYSGVEIQISGDDGKLTLFPGNVDTVEGGTLTYAGGPVERISSPRTRRIAIDIVGNLYAVGDAGVSEAVVQLKIEYKREGESEYRLFDVGMETRQYTHYWSAGRYIPSTTEGGPNVWYQVGYGNSDPAAHQNGDEHSPGNTWRWRSFGEIARYTPGFTNPISGEVIREPVFKDWDADPHPPVYYQVPSPIVTIRNASSKPVRLTFAADMPEEGIYRLRVTRLTADSTSDRLISNLSWSVMRSYQPDEANYSGQTRVALKIKASGQLNGQVEQFNALATARVPVLGPNGWTIAPTRNPAWQFLWFARGKKVGAKRYYGACLGEEFIDLPAIEDFAAFCDAKGLHFDAVFTSTQSCIEVLNRIAFVGRGSTSWGSGKLAPIWDEGGRPYVTVINMADIKPGSFQVSYVSENLAEEIVGTFVNKEKEWEQDQVRALVPGVTTPSSTATVELFGIVDPALAGRAVNLQAAAHAYLRRDIGWEMDESRLIFGRGDVVMLAHDMTNWGKGGRVVACDGRQILLDEAVSFGGKSQHWLVLVWPDGRQHLFRVQSGEGETDRLTLLGDWPADTEGEETIPWPVPDTDAASQPCDYRWVFDFKETPGKLVKITGIQPLNGGGARIQAQDEDPRYYAAEFNDYTYIPPGEAGGKVPTLSRLEISEELVRVGTGFGVMLTVTLDVSGPFELAIVRAGHNGGPLVEVGRVFGRRLTWQAQDSGQLQIEVTAISPSGETGEASRKAVDYTIAGKAKPPADVAGFSISGQTLSWPVVADIDLAGYRIRFNNGRDFNWATATPLHEGLVTGSPWPIPYWPAGQITILVKAEDTSGNQSLNPAYIITDLGDPKITNVVEVADLAAAGWPGVITGAAVAPGGELQAEETSRFYQADGNRKFYQADARAKLYPLATYAAASWTSEWISFGTMPAGTVLVAQLSATPGARLYYRLRSSAPFYPATTGGKFYKASAEKFYAPATDWALLPAAMPLPPAPLQLRLELPGGAEQGVATGLELIADAPDRAFSFENFVLDAGGTDVPLPADVIKVKGVNITLMDDGHGAVTVKIVDKDIPRLRAFNAAGVGVPATTYVEVKSY
jgi:hypothetical protein